MPFVNHLLSDFDIRHLNSYNILVCVLSFIIFDVYTCTIRKIIIPPYRFLTNGMGMRGSILKLVYLIIRCYILSWTLRCRPTNVKYWWVDIDEIRPTSDFRNPTNNPTITGGFALIIPPVMVDSHQ